MPDILSHSPTEEEIIELARYMVHKHYCENDVEAVISQFDEDLIWIGAGEDEFGLGGKAVSDIFRGFQGIIPPCTISEEDYHVQMVAPCAYLCSGRLWVSTEASTLISLRVHQRISLLFRMKNGVLRCCHVHVSNPYDDMHGDIGFPVKMALQSYHYLQEQVERQKKLIAEQTALLKRMSYEDTLTGLYNRNKFNELMSAAYPADGTLGIACFDLNGLKECNDTAGHLSGDDLLRRAGAVLLQFFAKKSYRIGGDEFVVIDEAPHENHFRSAIARALQAMQQEGISCSVGLSWRSGHCNVQEQFEEADRAMYADKRRHYAAESD